MNPSRLHRILTLNRRRIRLLPQHLSPQLLFPYLLIQRTQLQPHLLHIILSTSHLTEIPSSKNLFFEPLVNGLYIKGSLLGGARLTGVAEVY